MIIANKLKKSNIAEYVLYMWQVEDIIRAYNFDIKLIKQNIISKFNQPKKTLLEIEHWYEGLIDLMNIENIKHRGHISFVNSIIEDLNSIHINLLKDKKDKDYIEIYTNTEKNLNQLREKSTIKNISDIELCFNGLFGYLILKLQKKDVSKETEDAMKQFSELLKKLTIYYHSKS